MSKWPGFDLYAELIADVERRFWINVQKTETCWLWTGALDGKGYGTITIAGQARTASVVSWALTRGPIPPMGLICHHCDTPPCVRPDHLFLGDHSLNRVDANIKSAEASAEMVHLVTTANAERVLDRLATVQSKAEASRQARLDERRARQSATRKAREQVEPTLAVPMNFSDDEIRRIRSVPDERGVNRALSRQFHVSPQAIAAIRKRQTYRQVSDLPVWPDDTRKEDEAS